jgi:hypothetical protein
MKPAGDLSYKGKSKKQKAKSKKQKAKSRSLTPLAKSASGFGMTIFRLGVAKGTVGPSAISRERRSWS